MKKSIVERMTPLLASDLDEAVLNEQMLMDAVETADAILLANGLEVRAEHLEDYVNGLQDVLENRHLSEADHKELQEIWRALVRGVGHVARGIGKTVGTVKKVKSAIGRAVAHVGGEYASGHDAGSASKAGPDEFEKPAAKPKEPKEKKPGFLGGAWRSGMAAKREKEAAKKAATPAAQHVAASAEALKAKQAAAATAAK